MLSSLRQFISWAFLKVMFGAFIAVAATAIYALWLFNHDDAGYAASREQYLAALQQRCETAHSAWNEAKARAELAKAAWVAQSDRAARAAKIAVELEGMQHWWNRFVGNREQWRINRQRIEHLAATEAEARAGAKKEEGEIKHAEQGVKRSARVLAAADAEWQTAQASASPWYFYPFRAWWKGKWAIVSLVVLYFFGPTLRKLGLFYHFAPRIARSRPLQLSGEVAAFPWLGKSSASIDVALWPGEQARIRKRYLESIEDGLWVKPRYFWSWRFPLTSLLSGVVHDMDVRNVRAGRDYRVTFAHHKHAEYELAVVHVPEGGSLVVRPSFLAGVILPPGQKLRFRRRWQLFRWQSWLTGQLRFIEFVGPCRLVVAGRPGLREERLQTREDGSVASCRAAQDKVIGFTPNLEYRLVRSARFWNYYRWDAMLFDASFSGTGFVLIQTALPGKKRGLLAVTRHRARRIFGL